jgi:RNA polymerase sigma-70 factor, ECF subfamily
MGNNKATRLGETRKGVEIAMTPPPLTFEDGALIQMALAGQSECFAVLMDRHMGAVRKCVHAIVRNATDAEDVLQEAVLKTWRRLSTFRSESSFRTWMTRVAVNEALMSHRQGRRRRLCRALGDRDVFASPVELQDKSLIRAEATRTIRSAVVGLPLKYRQVLILRDLQELSVRETAQRLHSTIPAVKSQLFRGRGMLLAAIQQSTAQGFAGAPQRRHRIARSGGS